MGCEQVTMKLKTRPYRRAWAIVCEGRIACDFDGHLMVFRTESEALQFTEPGDSGVLRVEIRVVRPHRKIRRKTK